MAHGREGSPLFPISPAGMKLNRLLSLLAAIIGVIVHSTSVRAQEPRPDHPDDPSAQHASAVPLYDDLGDYSRPVSTASSEARAYFDQGLRLHFAFNHPEAIRSFEEAIRYDPECALCWWGVALSSGPNINGAMDEAGGRRAFHAIQEARRLVSGGPGTGGAARGSVEVTGVERALVEALAERYDAVPSAPRPPLDSAYAQAMAEVARLHPDDPDVLTLYASSVMNLSPWHYWEGPFGEREPLPGTLEALDALERALSSAPENPGACHYFIHLTEAAYPERAVECADRLADLMPGAGHIVHMPGHIYIRVGRYADAVRANRHAVHSDESWISDVGISSLYTAGYYPHNYHFLAFAATMAGMSDEALRAARAVASKVDREVAEDVYWIQNAVVLPQLTLLTFGRWQDVLDEPDPPFELDQVTLMMHYARGTALAALGREGEARSHLDRARAIQASAGEPADDPMPHIAAHALAGEIALRAGDAEGAVEYFGAAAEVEDMLLYEEPPLWYYPVKQSLGRALLEAGRAVEAEAAYRADLAKFRENGWSLFGLARSLEVQGRAAEAAEVWARFRSAWQDADVTLEASRF